MTKAMKHPADYDPYRFFYVLFVKGKGYVSNYSAWKTGKEFLQYDPDVARASFWDGEDAACEALTACNGGGLVAVHYTQRNSKGVTDLDKNSVPEPPKTSPGGWSTFLEMSQVIDRYCLDVVGCVIPFSYSFDADTSYVDISFKRNFLRLQFYENLLVKLREGAPAGVMVRVTF